MELYKNPAATPEERAENLLSLMTIKEKIGQISQHHIQNQNLECSETRAREGLIGSRILASSAFGEIDTRTVEDLQKANKLQKIAVEESRLGIPIINGRDVIHGHRTVFPIPLGQAASWNDSLVEEASSISADEAYAYGVHWTFAPMIDVARDPRWGRIMEGAGEDPVLTSRMAVAAVKGYQPKIAACAKHFVGYGAAEGGRDYNTSEISDNTLRNIYLPPFKAAVDAGLMTVMSGFHELGGEPVSGSKYLLTDILKDEFGFDGFVISDWGSIPQLESHHVASDRKESAYRAFDAGVDMDMATNCYLDYIEELIKEGKISIERLNDAVRRILTVKFKIGLFEQPYIDLSLCETVPLSPKALALSEKLAVESLVLLKNDNNILPLDKHSGNKIAVIGPLASLKRNLLGDWMLDGKPEETPSIIEGIQQIAPNVNLITSDTTMDEAFTKARNADIVILVLGEYYANSGESSNVSDLTLPFGQEELISRFKMSGKPVITVIGAGRPLVLTNAAANSDALLYTWFPGTMGGVAIAKVLFGDEIPSGKTPVTFPAVTGQVPIYYNHKHNPHSIDEYYSECTRFAYVDNTGKPLYPFGFGLSYTSYEYGNVTAAISNGVITASCTVKNTGKRTGTEIVQCYIQDCTASVTRPVKELKDYKRISLSPGESKTVYFNLGEKELGFYNGTGKFTAENGKFKIWISGDSVTGSPFETEVIFT